ncbi:MAG: sensor of ECF-type sigma factor [Bacteroidetes bacterium]|nr:sensor of ECF-type sigma factor [Bacteroidota bacterium]
MKTNFSIYRLVILLVVITFSMPNYAQNGQKKKMLKDKIEAQKIAYITNELSLTATEAQQFWPIYNEFSDKNEELMKAYRKNNMEDKVTNSETISDKEALEMADEQIIQAQQILDLRKKYHIEFKKVLPPKKLLKLYQAEKEFKKFLLKEIKERREDRREDRMKR